MNFGALKAGFQGKREVSVLWLLLCFFAKKGVLDPERSRRASSLFHNSCLDEGFFLPFPCFSSPPKNWLAVTASQEDVWRREEKKRKKHGNALILCAGERGVSRKEGMMNKQEQEIEKCFKQYIAAPKLVFRRFQNMRSFWTRRYRWLSMHSKAPTAQKKEGINPRFFSSFHGGGKRSKRQIDEWVSIGAERGERGDRDGGKPRCVGLLIPPPPSVKW